MLFFLSLLLFTTHFLYFSFSAYFHSVSHVSPGIPLPVPVPAATNSRPLVAAVTYRPMVPSCRRHCWVSSPPDLHSSSFLHAGRRGPVYMLCPPAILFHIRCCITGKTSLHGISFEMPHISGKFCSLEPSSLNTFRWLDSSPLSITNQFRRVIHFMVLYELLHELIYPKNYNYMISRNFIFFSVSTDYSTLQIRIKSCNGKLE